MTTEEETTYITAAPVAPLRVCCYGSSSSRTPERYIDAAYTLGRTLAQRGHTCVNGAGSSGCMDAMNKGCDDAGGCIVGVIHEKFVKRGGDWFEGTSSVFRRDRGGVVVDEGWKVGGQTSGGGTGGGGKRNKNEHEHEIVIARGNDLHERKRLLVEGADALVVLPGGPGTWDEVRSYHNIESLYWRCLFCPPRPPFCIHFIHIHWYDICRIDDDDDGPPHLTPRFETFSYTPSPPPSVQVVGNGVREAHWVPLDTDRMHKCRRILRPLPRHAYEGTRRHAIVQTPKGHFAFRGDAGVSGVIYNSKRSDNDGDALFRGDNVLRFSSRISVIRSKEGRKFLDRDDSSSHRICSSRF